ncbi:hypothetical protein [Nostoc sp. 'Lobaria pulmonaria (5183) cyanobiont']|uniref:hypothetical protein n=1 Tax=Nostoc sp. 'Lobaria pulmonaria (5183) cyanobiont' TaxID=1618022 RepID=UPI001319F94E|nr:hypothetical protein [Nostoc sp. 'Lobaria pulmonaria (5183) cyanobiont']
MKVVENSPLNYWIIFQRAKLEGNDRADINASGAISGNIIVCPISPLCKTGSELKLLKKWNQVGKSYGKYHWNQRLRLTTGWYWE